MKDVMGTKRAGFGAYSAQSYRDANWDANYPSPSNCDFSKRLNNRRNVCEGDIFFEYITCGDREIDDMGQRIDQILRRTPYGVFGSPESKLQIQ